MGSVLVQIYDVACAGLKLLDAYKKAYENSDQKRKKVAEQAVRMLNRQGGFSVKVDSVSATYGGGYAEDIQVSIISKVKTRKNQYAENHDIVPVGITSWKGLENDLIRLGKTFEHACKRAYPDGDDTSVFLKTDYKEFLTPIQQKVTAELKPQTPK